MEDKYIYLVFSKTGTWLSRIIYLITKNKYAHSSLSMDPSLTKMYSFGRTNPKNPFSGGFVEENIYEGVYKIFRNSECIIYKVKISEEQYKLVKAEVDKFIIRKYELRYNFMGLFGVLFNKPVKRKNHYFCTQFVSHILVNGNIYDFKKEAELMKVDDLTDIPDKELIYKGNIYDYCNRMTI
ncbi:hypothetical protein [Clostridium manihotivorum]|uniref:Uncharacterized protein n=1 Tax=Clostridium manihotivorum TaxID=2320868 RepID=A0A3R5TDA4_9CLOT|nr:hypothetical protein [Clostridium manihotivorum]QAA30724.1 hypothetical protein C1I91_03025 [Clostridium manihotivorum]